MSRTHGITRKETGADPASPSVAGELETEMEEIIIHDADAEDAAEAAALRRASRGPDEVAEEDDDLAGE